MTTVAHWGGTSRFADLGGPVHWVDFGGPPDAPRVVLVHGLGGSHLNWCLLAPLLTARLRVAAVDLAGFGLTDPAGRGTAVHDHVALLDRFLREVVGEPAVLVGNSMGGMITILQGAAAPETARALVLMGPALPLPLGARPDPLVLSTFLLYSVPVLGEQLLARSRAATTAAQQVRRLLTLVCADPGAVPGDLVGASVELVEHRAGKPGLDAAFLTAVRSLALVNARRTAYWAAMRSLRMPVYLMSGERDRLVPVRAARAAAARHPGWRFETFPGVGHAPQLEVPSVVAGRLLDWVDGVLPARAAEPGGGRAR